MAGCCIAARDCQQAYGHSTWTRDTTLDTESFTFGRFCISIVVVVVSIILVVVSATSAN